MAYFVNPPDNLGEYINNLKCRDDLSTGHSCGHFKCLCRLDTDTDPDPVEKNTGSIFFLYIFYVVYLVVNVSISRAGCLIEQRSYSLNHSLTTLVCRVVDPVGSALLGPLIRIHIIQNGRI